MIVFYSIVFGISVLLTIIYISFWHKHYDSIITLIFVLVPMTNLAYILMSTSQEMREMIIAYKLTYLGGCFILPFYVLIIFNLCNIKLKKWIIIPMFVINSLLFVGAMSGEEMGIFYKGFSFELVNGTPILHKEYGFMHTLYYVSIGIYFASSIFAITYSYFMKKQVSRKTIVHLFALAIIVLCSFLVSRVFNLSIEFTPLGYTLALLSLIIIVRRLHLYNIIDSAIDSIVENGDIGFLSFDFKLNYLGSNETAKKILPALNNLYVDKTIKNDDEFKYSILEWIDEFDNDNSVHIHYYKVEDKTYLFDLNYLVDGKNKKGYHFKITDDTKNQEYIKLLNNYNEELSLEVDLKTKQIIEVNDKFILGMATMVEKRDNSTGGHIKRTSEGVKILMDEMMKDDLFTPAFYKNIIKAAPMHDLGKITVDDAILRKPGKYTPEEYDIMKTHAEAGAKIIQEIVDETYDKEFKKIALNVAHYHHERFDGSGYPDGLKGNDIPIEARIMAIADVYDALVSKRVYKEKFSFEKANSIIMEGFGTQFDKKLEKYFVNAREKLEKYYSSIDC